MTHQAFYQGMNIGSAATPSPPPQARAHGYNSLTYGQNVTLNTNYYLFDFLDVTPVTGQAAQQSDGSIILSPNGISDGSGYGANICSAQTNGASWSGKVFGGGMYTEIVAKWPSTTGPGGLPFPAYWMLSIDFLTGDPLQWPGQATGYIHRIELDHVQSELASLPNYYSGVDVIDWYSESGSVKIVGGITPGATTSTLTVSDVVSGAPISTGQGVYSGAGTNSTLYGYITAGSGTSWTIGAVATVPSGTTLYCLGQVSQPSNGLVNYHGVSSANYNTYGSLWVPATSTTPGFVQPFLNGNLVVYAAGSPVIQWDQYSSANPPPPIIGTSAASLTDESKFALIAGTRALWPMQIQSISVWQQSDANNVVQ